MQADAARLDLRLRRRSIIWFTVGLAIYAYLIVAMYPSVKSDQSLGSLTADNPTVGALLGVSGSLTSPVGWVNGNLYTNFLPLIILLMTIGYGAAAIAGQSESGQLGLVATLPIGRRRLICEKSAVLALIALPLTIATMICILLGGHYGLTLPTGPVVSTTFAIWLMGVDFGLLALLIGALTGVRALALGIASAVALVSFLISSLAPIVDVAHALRPLSLFYWAIGGDQLSKGLSATAWVVLFGAAVVLQAASLGAIERLDIR